LLLGSIGEFFEGRVTPGHGTTTEFISLDLQARRSTAALLCVVLTPAG
jgi:hypothetical protein